MEFYHGGLPSALRYFFSFFVVVRVFSFGGYPISSKAIRRIKKKKPSHLLNRFWSMASPNNRIHRTLIAPVILVLDQFSRDLTYLEYLSFDEFDKYF